MTRRIGIYSGTFDPIHNGHIAFAKAALSEGLDEIVFIPEANPRNKTKVTTLEHRAAMAKQATHPHDGLRTLTLSSSRFTIVDTIPELRQLFPDAELSLLIGSDVARTLVYRWQGLELLADSRFIVGMRQNDTIEEIETIARQITSRYNIHFSLIPARQPTVHVSSSTIRAGDTSHLPAEITRYIQLNNLYIN